MPMILHTLVYTRTMPLSVCRNFFCKYSALPYQRFFVIKIVFLLQKLRSWGIFQTRTLFRSKGRPAQHTFVLVILRV